MTLAESLNLPIGWVATRFPNTIELERTLPSGAVLRTGIPVPYSPMTAEQWNAAAEEAITKTTAHD